MRHIAHSVLLLVCAALAAAEDGPVGTDFVDNGCLHTNQTHDCGIKNGHGVYRCREDRTWDLRCEITGCFRGYEYVNGLCSLCPEGTYKQSSAPTRCDPCTNGPAARIKYTAAGGTSPACAYECTAGWTAYCMTVVHFTLAFVLMLVCTWCLCFYMLSNAQLRPSGSIDDIGKVFHGTNYGIIGTGMNWLSSAQPREGRTGPEFEHLLH